MKQSIIINQLANFVGKKPGQEIFNQLIRKYANYVGYKPLEGNIHTFTFGLTKPALESLIFSATIRNDSNWVTSYMEYHLIELQQQGIMLYKRITRREILEMGIAESGIWKLYTYSELPTPASPGLEPSPGPYDEKKYQFRHELYIEQGYLDTTLYNQAMDQINQMI